MARRFTKLLRGRHSVHHATVLDPDGRAITDSDLTRERWRSHWMQLFDADNLTYGELFAEETITLSMAMPQASVSF